MVLKPVLDRAESEVYVGLSVPGCTALGSGEKSRRPCLAPLASLTGGHSRLALLRRKVESMQGRQVVEEARIGRYSEPYAETSVEPDSIPLQQFQR